MQAPTIRTERLTLDAHRADDLDALAAIWADPAVTRHIGGRMRDREEVWIRLLRAAGQWALMGRGPWAVRARGDGALIGEVGLLDARRATEPPLGDAPEAAWVLAPSAQGRGLAREALVAAFGWIDRHVERTACIIAPGNAASIRLAERLGFRQTATVRYHGEPTLAFSRERVR